jgi:tRNA (adenine37-N6)-methyltransferase
MSETKDMKLAYAAGVSSIGLALYFVHKWYKADKACKLLEESYWAERRGRVRVEQEMRKLAEIQLNTSEGFFVQPVGVIESCYRQCVGTPRQGLLVPNSRAAVVLTSNMSPEAMDGLEEFSHVWLSFKFHLNTNLLKEAKAFQGVVDDISGDSRGNRKYTFTAKITPPMLKEKKGVLATRSPHRPNPIGVTLARVEKVDKKTRRLHVSACDLVNGTPILDIKPFVPMYDTANEDPKGHKVPAWINETIHTRNVVTISASVPEQVLRIAKKLKQFKDEPDAFIAAMRETLEADVRSKFQTKRRMQDATEDFPTDVPFDNATIFYLWQDLRTFHVTDVKLTSQIVKEREKEEGILTTAERAEKDVSVVTTSA